MSTAHYVHIIHHPEVEADPSKAKPMVMPGGKEELAAEIGAVSPEGRPADPKMGPAGLHWLVVLVGFFILAASAGVGLLIDPAAGIVMLLLGGVAFAFSPGVLAAFARANEREEVAKTMSDRTESHPDVVCIKDPSKQRPPPPAGPAWRGR